MPPAVAAAAIVAGGTVYAGKKSSEAAKDAAAARERASDEGVAFQREALEALRSDLDPYRQFGQSALGPLSGLLGTGDSLSQVRAQDAVRQQIGGVQSKPRTLETPQFNQQFMSDPKKFGDYQAQLQKVNSMSESDPDYRRQSSILEGMESQLPIEDLVRITPQTGLAKQRLGKYYAEKGIEPPQGVASMQFTSEGWRESPQTQQSQQMQQSTNPLLDIAMDERAAYDPLNNPLLSRAQTERMEFDPLSNQLLQSAAEKQMAYDPSQAMSPQILQNPLLQAMQEDVTRRLMANQAARGKLGSGGTAESLQQRLVPQAIQFGLQMNELNRQDIADRARLGGVQVGLQEAAMTGREGLGFGIDQLQRQAITDRMQAGLTQEDLRQRDISNLMAAASMGQSSAAQAGAAGQNAATNMGALAQQGAAAQAAGTLGAAKARNQMVGGLVGAGLYGLGKFKPSTQTAGTYNQFQPTAQQWDALFELE